MKKYILFLSIVGFCAMTYGMNNEEPLSPNNRSMKRFTGRTNLNQNSPATPYSPDTPGSVHSENSNDSGHKRVRMDAQGDEPSSSQANLLGAFNSLAVPAELAPHSPVRALTPLPEMPEEDTMEKKELAPAAEEAREDGNSSDDSFWNEESEDEDEADDHVEPAQVFAHYWNQLSQQRFKGPDGL